MDMPWCPDLEKALIKLFSQTWTCPDVHIWKGCGETKFLNKFYSFEVVSTDTTLALYNLIRRFKIRATADVGLHIDTETGLKRWALTQDYHQGNHSHSRGRKLMRKRFDGSEVPCS